MSESKASPIAYPVNIARLPARGMLVKIEADVDQRAALASEHGLRAVERFRAELEVTSWKRGGVKVVGRVRAAIVQDCIVTLDPLEASVDEEISAIFVPEGSKLALPKTSAEGEILLDAEGEDGPELFSGDSIDVGQLAEEHFALGIDPYPRKAGVALPDAGDGEDEPRGPLYEKLAALKSKL